MGIFKTKIDVSSFLKEGIKCYNDDFSIQLITGYQGTGKTWFAIYLLENAQPRKVFTNIQLSVE